MAEYAGETLKTRLERGPLPVDDALAIAAQVASGLSCAHGAGIVHRDVKPANIMLPSAGGLKILDFGLAVDPAVTMMGGEAAWGTLAYMSPEQAGGESFDAGSDIWALGAILYEMLAGRPPFQADSARGVLAAILRAEPPALGDLRPDTPRDVLRIVARALAPARAARYRDVEEMFADLGAARTQTASGGSVAVRRTPSIAVLPFSDLSPAKDQDWFC
jgi:serine/threonine protein kinase